MTNSEPEGHPVCLELDRPGGADPLPDQTWSIAAYNKRSLAGWQSLCHSTPQNALHCYDWLARNAMVERGQRCFALRGKRYTGVWCYEIGKGDRVYYKPDQNTKKAVIYYAGKHPLGVPLPPPDL